MTIPNTHWFGARKMRTIVLDDDFFATGPDLWSSGEPVRVFGNVHPHISESNSLFGQMKWEQSKQNGAKMWANNLGNTAIWVAFAEQRPDAAAKLAGRNFYVARATPYGSQFFTGYRTPRDSHAFWKHGHTTTTAKPTKNAASRGGKRRSFAHRKTQRAKSRSERGIGRKKPPKIHDIRGARGWHETAAPSFPAMRKRDTAIFSPVRRHRGNTNFGPDGRAGRLVENARNILGVESVRAHAQCTGTLCEKRTLFRLFLELSSSLPFPSISAPVLLHFLAFLRTKLKVRRGGRLKRTLIPPKNG